MEIAGARALRVVVAKRGRDGHDRGAISVDDVPVTVGGTIAGHDSPELNRLGVAAVFTPGAPLIDFLLQNVSERTPA